MQTADKRHHWTEPDEWVATAPVREGSWWEAMSAWLREHSGTRVRPPALAPASVLSDAPGDYVKVRYAD